MWPKGAAAESKTEKITMVWMCGKKGGGRSFKVDRWHGSAGKRNAGRPKKSWGATVKKEMDMLGVDERMTIRSR